MKHIARSLTFAVLAATALAAPAPAHGSPMAQTKGLVKILAPKDKATVGDTVDVKWKISKGGKISHVHLYLDGEELGPQNGGHKVLRKLSKGTHTVRVGVATSSHHEVGTDTVTITVK